jgi:hypothetical protein
MSFYLNRRAVKHHDKQSKRVDEQRLVFNAGKRIYALHAQGFNALCERRQWPFFEQLDAKEQDYWKALAITGTL